MPADLILTIAAVITAVGVIIAALAAIYRFVKKISDSIGVDSKGRTLAERLDRVEHQLWENGGSSLADRVNLINDQTIKTATEVDLIKRILINSNTSQVEVVKKTRVRKAS
jgi:hypothetical protein